MPCDSYSMDRSTASPEEMSHAICSLCQEPAHLILMLLVTVMAMGTSFRDVWSMVDAEMWHLKVTLCFPLGTFMSCSWNWGLALLLCPGTFYELPYIIFLQHQKRSLLP